MRSQTTLAFNEVVDSTKLNKAVIIEAIESALVTAYRRSVNASSAQHVTAHFSPDTGDVKVYAEKEVVEDVADERTEVTLAEARLFVSTAQMGDLALVESTPPDFGRIAAQTAKQVILQRLREAEREDQYLEFAKREGEIVHGTIQSVTTKEITLSTGRSEAIMPRIHTMPGEKYRTHDKIRAFVVEVKRTPRGPQIIVSRKHRNMLRRLLEMEVPEIYNGVVEIKSIAREAGQRSKVAVSASQSGVDPVGACVGMRGVRIQSIVRELNDEKIDVLDWSADHSAFIQKALSPARVSGVYLDDDLKNGRTATVIVPDDQLSLAIGREGQNARLAAKLTNWRIDIKSTTEAARDALEGIRGRGDMLPLLEELGNEMGQADYTLQKKAEGRPIAPEEFSTLAKIADKYETRRLELRHARRQAESQHRREVRGSIAKLAYQTPLEFSGIPISARKALEAAGYKTAGKVLEALRMDRERTTSTVELDTEVWRLVENRLMEIRDPDLQALQAASAEEAAAQYVEEEPIVAEAPVAPVTHPAATDKPAAPAKPVVEETAPAEATTPEPVAEEPTKTEGKTKFDPYALDDDEEFEDYMPAGRRVFEVERDADAPLDEEESESETDFATYIDSAEEMKSASLMQTTKKGTPPTKKDTGTKKKPSGREFVDVDSQKRVPAPKKRKSNRRTVWDEATDDW